MSIVITGVAGRFPGANSYVDFFQNLSDKKSSIVEIPKDRWDWEAYYGDPDEKNGVTKCKWAGFVDGFDCFDNDFFNISARESEFLDPQQRVLLELAWHCIEDSSHSPEELRGKKVGVYIGVCHNDYKEIQERFRRNYEAYASIGTHPNMLANRISYFFDFHGPSYCVDTACSSSLFAFHQAVNSIRNGDCEFAIAGGINYLGTEGRHLTFSKMGMLSPSGRCKTFDADADGYVRGEGAGLVFIKKLSAAEQDRDHIYAQLAGSGVNHGGSARTITSPSVYGQSSLLVDIYTKNDIDISNVRHIECHGTATPLGDPIEINALKRSFKKISDITGKKTQEGACTLGSVKTNIGHLEGAAGVAGLIKSCLMLTHNAVPELQNFDAVNPRIKLESSPFKLATSESNLFDEKCDEDAYVGVSSFGFGGANAHVVLKRYLNKESLSSCHGDNPTELSADGVDRVVVFSAQTQSSLFKSIETTLLFLSDLIEQNKSSHTLLTDLAYTLAVGRAAFDHRSVFVVKSCDELARKISEFLDGGHVGACSKVEAPVARKGGFVAQWGAQTSRVAKAWLAYKEFDWGDFWEALDGRRMSLPGYCFERRKFFIQPHQQVDLTTRVNTQTDIQGLGEGVMRKVVLRELNGAFEAKLPPVQNTKVASEDKVSEALNKVPESPNDDPVLEDWLSKKLSEVISRPLSKDELDVSFQALGVDSVLGVDLIRSINKEYGLNLKATFLYDYSSPRALLAGIYGSVTEKQVETQSPGTDDRGVNPVQEPPGVVMPAMARETAQPMADDVQSGAKDFYGECAEILREVLDYRGEKIPADEEFSKLGVDSVTGVDFAKRIRQAFDLNYEVRHIYDYPTLTLTVNYLQSLTSPSHEADKIAPKQAASVEDILQAFESDDLTLDDALAALMSEAEA